VAVGESDEEDAFVPRASQGQRDRGSQRPSPAIGGDRGPTLDDRSSMTRRASACPQHDRTPLHARCGGASTSPLASRSLRSHPPRFEREPQSAGAHGVVAAARAGS